MANMFEQGYIEIQDATQNNLKHVNLRVPKYQTTVFVGLSGSGKSSLVFDTIAAASRRELNETFPSFTQQYLPKFGQPHVGQIAHLPVAIVIEQQRLGKMRGQRWQHIRGFTRCYGYYFRELGSHLLATLIAFRLTYHRGCVPRVRDWATLMTLMKVS